MLSYPRSENKLTRRQQSLKVFVLVLSAIFALVILNSPISSRSGVYTIKSGDVAIQDIQSPRTFTYASEILTQKSRQQASSAIPSVYLPVDPAIKKKQLEKLNEVLGYISNVRDDSYATNEQKIKDLSQMADVRLSDESIQRILSLTNTRWAAIKAETFNVLDDAMRITIREDNLESTRRNIVSLVDISFPTDQVKLITEIVSPLITANSLFSPELTAQAKAEAEQKVEPVTRSFIMGQLIVQRGQIVRPEDIEVLEFLGLTGQDNRLMNFLASLSLVGVLSIFVVLYSIRRRANPLDDLRSVALIAILFNVFLLLARFVIPYRVIMPFIFPMAAFGLTLATAFNLETGLVFSLILSILTGYGLPGSLEITVFYILGSITGLLVLGRGRKISSFFYASMVITAANILVVLAFRLGDPSSDWVGLITLAGASLTNGLASASLTLILQYVLSQALGITTALQLLEISRSDHPLLQYILRNAAGTYQHSLQVANLAEQAAEKINADSLLVRVGALYHDAGKALNPAFFIENQVTGNLDAHDDLDPAETATTIIKHVEDGLKLAHEYRLPPEVETFISEHHGKSTTKYQLSKAKEQLKDGKEVDLSKFEYPGPNPHTRETAILMMADKVEARARAEIPKTDEEITKLVETSIDTLLHDKFLDNTSLSMKNIQAIKESFFQTLKNTYHHRLKYPK